MGAQLASVHNVQEYHEIQKMIVSTTHDYPRTWLGGSDAQEVFYLPLPNFCLAFNKTFNDLFHSVSRRIFGSGAMVKLSPIQSGVVGSLIIMVGSTVWK